MEDNMNPIECNSDDVVTISNNIYKIGRFKTVFNEAFKTLASNLHQHFSAHQVIVDLSNPDKLFKSGIDCEILNLGSQKWKKGKVLFKLSVEFYIEEEPVIKEPESPLDDLRQMIVENNS
jgi:ribosomal protein L31E